MSDHVTYARGQRSYSVVMVYVGSAGHLQRYKVLDADGKFVEGGLFRTSSEAENFVIALLRKENEAANR